MTDKSDVNNDEVARLETAIADLKRANERYLAALSAADARGEIDSCEVKQVARNLKRFTRVLPRKDPGEIEELAARYNRLAGELEPSVPDEGTESQPLEPSPSPHPEILPPVSVSDDTSEEQLLAFEEKWAVVSAMNGGLSARDALKKTGVKRSARWARNAKKSFAEHGISGLQDRRVHSGSGQTVLTSETRGRVRSLYHERPVAGASALHHELCRELAAAGQPLPSYEVVRKCVASYSPIERLMRTGNLKELKDEVRARMATPVTRYGNERWQADSSRLDVWIRVWEDGRWVPSSVWIAAIIDAHTRAIAGVILRARTMNAWDLHGLLIHATQPKEVSGWPVHGIPRIMQTDQGGDFNSASWVAALGSLVIRHDPDPGDYPQRKARIERLFHSLDSGCLRMLPGHKALGRSEGSGKARIEKLLTLEQLHSEIIRWIVEDYQQRIHSATGRRPAEYWEECTPLRFVPMEKLPSAVTSKTNIYRKVQRTGIRWTLDGVKRVYWSPALQPHVGRTVNIRYNPEALDTVWVFDRVSGHFIGETPRVNGSASPQNIGGILRALNQFARGFPRGGTVNLSGPGRSRGRGPARFIQAAVAAFQSLSARFRSH